VEELLAPPVVGKGEQGSRGAGEERGRGERILHPSIMQLIRIMPIWMK